MITARDYAKNAFRCAFYEAQDVLTEVADVDLIHLQPKRNYAILYPLQKQLIWRDFLKKAVTINMAFEPVRLAKKYDLIIAHLPLMQDLIQLSAIRGWRDHCEKSICWIDEVYATGIKAYHNWLPALNGFDHIVVGLSGTVNAFSNAMNRPCHYVPGAVDTIRYSPYPGNSRRVIDIYSIGRIWESAHNAFKEYAAKNGKFYVYDTSLASHVSVKDYRQHRQMHADMAKRSRFYYVAPAKMDISEETGGQIEIGFRYYEATAAGTILVGQIPDCREYHSTFNWPNAVIQFKEDGRDIGEVLSRIDHDPRRQNEISRRNAAEALLRHDWVYRWRTILEIAGFDVTGGMKRRERRLKDMAEQIGNA